MKYRFATVFVALSIVVTPVFSEALPEECFAASYLTGELNKAMKNSHYMVACEAIRLLEEGRWSGCIEKLHSLGSKESSLLEQAFIAQRKLAILYQRKRC